MTTTAPRMTREQEIAAWMEFNGGKWRAVRPPGSSILLFPTGAAIEPSGMYSSVYRDPPSHPMDVAIRKLRWAACRWRVAAEAFRRHESTEAMMGSGYIVSGGSCHWSKEDLGPIPLVNGKPDAKAAVDRLRFLVSCRRAKYDQLVEEVCRSFPHLRETMNMEIHEHAR